ncbi:MAG: type II toxin-antitoxin system PemK/MazF family toxin [Nitrososphaerales archaeon]
METISKKEEMISQREIILLSFPFNDLRTSKVRPAIVISNNEYNNNSNDIIVVPLTTNLTSKDYAFVITNNDLDRGRLIKDSNVRVDRILSIDKNLVRLVIGRVNRHVQGRIKKIISELIK